MSSVGDIYEEREDLRDYSREMGQVGGQLGEYGGAVSDLQGRLASGSWQNFRGSLGDYESAMAPALDSLNKAGRKNRFNPKKSWKIKPTTVGAGRVERGALGDTLLREADAGFVASDIESELTRQAEGDLALGRSLSPEQIRESQQSTRAAYGARGLGTSAGAGTAEVLNRDRYATARESQRRDFASGVEGMSQDRIRAARGFATDVQGQELARETGNVDRDLDVSKTNAATRMATRSYNAGVRSSTYQQGIDNEYRQAGALFDAYDPQRVMGGVGTPDINGISGSVMQYGMEVNDWNSNALESRYLNKQNNEIALKTGRMQAGAAGDAADAAVTGSSMEAAGTVLAGAAVAAAAAICWLSREVFGPESMEWVRYRDWLLDRAPVQWRMKYFARARGWAAHARRSDRGRVALTALLRGQMDEAGLLAN